MKNENLNQVDWTQIPAPIDDGSADHLAESVVPNVTLLSTEGNEVNLANLSGWSVLFFYPMTGRPDVALPDNWNDTPGARGCTPQSCAFRDLYTEFTNKGVSSVYGISTQSRDYQQEAVNRLQLPFSLLSDDSLELSEAMRLPTMTVNGQTLIRRLTLVLENAAVRKVFFPVFPPDQNPQNVLNYLNTRDVSND